MHCCTPHFIRSPARLPPAGTSELQQRAVAAVVASLTADAAAMGVQWIYDAAALKKLEQERKEQVGAGACWVLLLLSRLMSRLRVRGYGRPPAVLWRAAGSC